MIGKKLGFSSIPSFWSGRFHCVDIKWFACGLLAFGLLPLAARSEIIPSSLRIEWAGVAGVPGGIPNRQVIFTTLQPGASAASINSAIANCPSNQVVYLAAGTYNISSTINFGSRSGVTLRGAGPGKTIINSSASGTAAIVSDQYGQTAATSILSDLDKGSTNITLSSAANFNVGDIIILSQENEAGLVYSKGVRNMRQRSIVTAKNDNTLTFWPPLAYPFSSSLSPQCAKQNGPGLRFSGLEDMTVITTASQNIVWFDATYACWVKNVTFRNCDEASVFVTFSLNFEMRHCDARQTRSTDQAGYGIYLYKESSFCLIEDNIFESLYCGVLASASTGNVIIYNYSTNSYNPSWLYQLGNFINNHGPHGLMSLWEGNYTEQYQNDAYHGSTSHQTVFRNVIHGLHPTKTGNRKMLDLCRFSYYHNVVGNVLGHTWASSSAAAYEMTGNPSYTEQPVIYRLGYPNMGNNGFTAANPMPGEPSYPDEKVKGTLLRHGNFDYKNQAIIWDSAITDRVIPPSLFYKSKPAYFGNLRWPPIDPVDPSYSGSITNIPAGYRYVYGTDPLAGAVNQSPVARSSANPTFGVPPLTVAFSSLGSSDPEGAQLTYSWNFGDGTAVSTVANPSHVYQSAGSYFARLTVSDGTNSVSSPDINVRVGNQPPVVNASASPTSGKAPLAVTFSSSGTSDPEGATLTYTWNFGDGTATSSSANPIHTYTANGNYTARLTVSDGQNSVSSQNILISVSDGLVAAYSFDEGTGSTVADSSASGNSGTVQGATWASTGRFGKALQFDGNSLVIVPDNSSLDLTTSLTFEAWVYPTQFSGDYQSIIVKPLDNPFTRISYALQGASRDTSVPSLALTSSQSNLASTQILHLNTWSHLSATYDGTTLRLYLNGVLVASRIEAGGGAGASSEPLQVGYGWTGLIDEVRIYNRVLGATEIQDDMTRPIGFAKPAVPTGLQIVP